MADLVFRRDFVPRYGQAVPVAPGVRRVTAPNPGPLTFTGTNSYIVGSGRVAIIDPGPADEFHFRALMAATAGETVTHILVTHAHRDHSGGVRRLAARPARRAMLDGVAAPSRTARRRRMTRHRSGFRAGHGALRRGAHRRRRLAGGGDRHARPRQRSFRLRARRTRPHLLGRPRHGLVDDRRGAAGRVDGGLYGLARPAACAARGHLPSRPWRPGQQGARLRPRADDAIAANARQQILAALAAGNETIPAIVATVYPDLDAAAFRRRRPLGARPSGRADQRKGEVASDGPPGPAARFRLIRC